MARARRYYVYGSSWGTVLAQEFAVGRPAGLRGLVLDGALCDGPTYIRTQWRDRLSTMPTYTQQLLRTLEDRKARAVVAEHGGAAARRAIHQEIAALRRDAS